MPERAAPLQAVLPAHPLLAQRWLELRAHIRALRRAPAQGGFLLLAWLGLALLLVAAARAPLREALLQTAALALAWPWISVAVLLAWTAALLRGSILRFDQDCAQGWLAALPSPAPLHRQGRRRWLWMYAGTIALLSSSALLGALYDAPLTPAARSALILSPLAAAAIAAWWLGTRPARFTDASDGIARVLASAPRRRLRLMPPRGPLPELADWQQRAAQRRWRQGRGSLWLLVLWLLIPAGEAGPVLLVLAVLGLALAALRNVLAASIVAIDQAEALLAASPRRRAWVCASALPYPLSRLLAMGLLAAALILPLGGAFWAAAAGAGLVLLGLLELVLALRFAGAPRRRRIRYALELTLLALMARHGLAPLLPLVLPGLIAWHLRKAWTLP
jgi:hypothetical protein